MRSSRKHNISYFGEFIDKDLEREFFAYDIMHYTKIMGPVALIFGVIYLMFFISDYFALDNPNSILIILIIRLLFLFSSVTLFIAVKKVQIYLHMTYLITAYEVFAIICFLVILNQYETHTLLLFFSIMALTLAIYIVPNRIFNSRIISAFLGLSFFVFYARTIEGMDASLFLKILSYYLIILIYCNIGTYLTNYYKRKQYLDGKELRRVSVTDTMTGIYNRAKFNEELYQWIDQCNSREKYLSLALFDIDNFKRINDDYGHLIGDGVIQNIVVAIKKTLEETDVFARWGGDEFALLYTNKDIYQAKELTERILKHIQKIKYENVENITCSFGLVQLRKKETAESLLQRVDILLYEAKNSGKNAICCEAGAGEQ
jgi:diguanylate cyclase (GGDEF)-like protein